MTKEEGPRDKGQGTRDKDQGTRDKDQGARDKDQGARAKARTTPSTFIFHPSSFPILDLGLGIFFLALYAVTLSPGLLPADAGEYQLVGAVLGVAHPPGFALYTLLSWLISRLPIIQPATAINALSALVASLSLVSLNRAVRALTDSVEAGLGAALALGFSTTFWAQATTANVRMPTAFAVAFALDRIVIYRRAKTSRSLGLVALALGLGVSHHASLIFVAAMLGVYTLWLDPSALRRANAWPLAWGLLPFVVWIYFPLRAGAIGAPAGIATLDGFLEHVLARGFSGDILFFAHLKDLPDRLLILGNILTFEFVWPLLALAALGALAALRRDRPFGLLLLAAFAVHSFIAITYRAPQTVEYLLPSYVLMAALTGFALAELLRLPRLLTAESAAHPKAWPSLGHVAGLSLTTVMIGIQFTATFPSYRLLAHDTSARDYAESVLTAAPSNAVILSSWHWATPLWYLQYVEGRRPDVEVEYVFPRSASLAQDWVDEIKAAMPTRPVVVTSFYPQEYGALPYRFLPLGPAWAVRAEPPMTPPVNLVGFKSFGNWTFLGYHLEASSVQSVDLVAAWSASDAPRDINFYVHLVGPDEQLYGQMDVSHPASGYVTGEVLLDRYLITPLLNAAPGEYSLVAGAYLPDGTRLAEVPLTKIMMAEPQPLITDLPPGTIPIGGAIFLTGLEVSPAGPVRPGDTLTVALGFLAGRAITSDYAVSVTLFGNGWKVQSDSTPAGGAIPTLKWIAGSRITDRHRLVVPADAAAGPAQLALLVYDAFTQQSLPVLDARLAALGPTVPLGMIEITRP